MEELVRYTRALLLLQMKQIEAAAVTGNGSSIRFELVLADAGFGAREIADLLGKNYGAVAKAISRARIGRARQVGQGSEQDGGESGE